MTEYLVRTPSGAPMVILECADRVDADLYASRNLKGVGDIVEVQSSETHQKSLEESFTTIMGDEELGKLAAKGRDTRQSDPRRIVVPRQLAGGRQEELTEAQQERQEEIEQIKGNDLEESFRRMGFSDSAAKIAAQGRN